MSIQRAFVLILVAVTFFLGVTGGAVHAEFSETGAPLEPGSHLIGSEIIISSVDNLQYEPAVAYSRKHRGYLVVWRNPDGIYGQRITGDGKFVGPSPFPIATGSKIRREPAVDYDPINDRFLVVWMHDLNGDGSNWDLSGRFIHWDDTIPNPNEFKICPYYTNQWHPKVAYAETMGEFLVVWADKSGTSSEIDGIRIKASNGSFPPPGHPQMISTGTEYRDSPDVAYNLKRNEYLVVWDVGKSSLDIYGVRLTGDFVKFGAPPYEFSIAGWPDDEGYPAVAACKEADQFLVAWESKTSTPPVRLPDIYVRYVSGDGVPGSLHLLSNTPINEIDADVSCDMSGQQYLVTWMQQYSNSSGPYGIFAQMVFPNNTKGEPVEIKPLYTGDPDRTNPAVAGGHTNYFVAWEHMRNNTAFRDIHGRLFTPHVVFLPLALRSYSH